MLQRDYLSKIIESFTKQMEVYLKDAVILRKTESIGEVEEALGELLELDPDMLLSLSPDSLVTMIALGGNGDALGDSVAYVWGMRRRRGATRKPPLLGASKLVQWHWALVSTIKSCLSNLRIWTKRFKTLAPKAASSKGGRSPVGCWAPIH